MTKVYPKHNRKVTGRYQECSKRRGNTGISGGLEVDNTRVTGG
jgi:hypothetical protein